MKSSTLSILALCLVACSKSSSGLPPPPAIDSGDSGEDTGIPDTTSPDLGVDTGSPDAPIDSNADLGRVDTGFDAGGSDGLADTWVEPTEADLADSPTPIGPTMPHTAPLTACTNDTITFGTGSTSAVGPTAANMINAWTKVAGLTVFTNGVILVRLSGLTSNPLSVTATVGSTDDNSPPNISTFAKSISFPLDINAADGTVIGHMSPGDWEINFPAANGGWVLEPGDIGIGGTFDYKGCAYFPDLVLQFDFPMSTGSEPFAGSTVGALFGPNATGSIGTGSTYEVAWQMVLEGPGYMTGGSP